MIKKILLCLFLIMSYLNIKAQGTTERIANPTLIGSSGNYSGWSLSNTNVFANSSGRGVLFRIDGQTNNLTQNITNVNPQGNTSPVIKMNLGAYDALLVANSESASLTVYYNGVQYMSIETRNGATTGGAYVYYYNGASGNYSRIPMVPTGDPAVANVNIELTLPNNVPNSGQLRFFYNGAGTAPVDDFYIGSVSLITPTQTVGCTNTMYLAQGDPDVGFYRINTSTNPFTYPLLKQYSSVLINAIGINPIDGNMYGMRYSTNTLVRIEIDGTFTDLGTISGLPDVQFNTGDIDSAGNYYVKPTGLNNKFYKINLNTNVVTPLTISTSLELSDWAFNTADGQLYGVNLSTERLFKINPSTGTVTPIGGTYNTSDVFGAMFGATNGEIYGASNNGGFYQFNTVTGARTLISGSPAVSQNDGAHCVTAPISFNADLYVTKTDSKTTYTSGSSTTYTIVAGNNGPFGVQNALVSDLVPAGVPSANVSYTAVASSGSATQVVGTQTGAISDYVSLPVGGKITYTVTVNIPTTFTGDLVNTVTITSPNNSVDSSNSNNSATDTDTRLCVAPATPTVSAGGLTIFCAGGSVTLTSSSATGNQWYKDGVAISGATGQTYSANASGTYTVVVTIVGCPSAASAGTTVTVNPIPPALTVSTGGPTTFCTGGSVVLTSTYNTTGAYQWYLNGTAIPGAIYYQYTATASGTYTVTRELGGCTSPASAGTTVTVNAIPATPTISAGGSTTICAGGSVTLTSSSGSGNQWYKDGVIISGATGQTYAANTSGTYTVIVTAGGCPSTSSAGITVNNCIGIACNTKFYLTQYPVSGPTTLYELDNTTNPFTITSIGTSPANIHVNAIGYNTVDNLIYGIRTDTGFTNYMVRIDGNGVFTSLGAVTNLPTGGYNSGAFDNGGNYYVLNSGSTRFYRIDVTTNTATLITLSRSLNVNDIVYDKTTGKIFGYEGVSGANILVSIDPATGTVTNIGASGLPDGTLVGALYVDAAGDIFGNADNGSGFYQFNKTTGTAVKISNSIGANGNDGTNCPDAVITFPADLSITKTDGKTVYTPGTTNTYTIVVSNNSGQYGVLGATVSDPVPAGIPAANVSYSVPVLTSGATTSITGTQTGALNDVVGLPIGATIIYTVTINVPVAFTGNLANTVTVTPPVNSTDPNNANNSATDTDINSCTITASNPDSDGDGISDACDLDDDNDGILDCAENGLNGSIEQIYKLNGNALKINSGEVRLTDNTNQSGRVMSYGKIDFSKSFSFSIDAYLGNNDGGADGIAIVFHNDPSGVNASGVSGMGLGAKGIQNGIALELDTYQNTGEPSADHGQIWKSSDQSVITTPINLPNLEDGNWHTVKITWDSSLMELSYTVDGILAGSYTGNIVSNYFGGANKVYFGYTASTGALYNIQSIRIPAPCLLPIELDTDGDGIPDRLDLDSDNDGCVDAIEGDENVTSTMLVTASGTVTVGTGSSASNQNLGITVDVQGVPAIVNSGGAADIGGDQGQGVGTSQNKNITACLPICGFDNTNGGNTTPVPVAKSNISINAAPTITYLQNASASPSKTNEFDFGGVNLTNSTGGTIPNVLVDISKLGFWTQNVSGTTFKNYTYNQANQAWEGTLGNGQTAYFKILGVSVNGTAITNPNIRLLPVQNSASVTGYHFASTSNTISDATATFTDGGTGIQYSITGSTVSLPQNLPVIDLGALANGSTLTNVKIRMGLVMPDNADAWINNADTGTGDIDYYVYGFADVWGTGYDFGDAPASYGTAQHAPALCSPAIYIGPNRQDYESSVVGSAAAHVDDLNLANYDDENDNLPDYSASQTSYSITLPYLNNAASGTVSAWIDWNNNGTFDASERANATISAGSGNIILTWKTSGSASGEGIIPSGITTGYKMVRSRIGTISSEILNASGIATDGEVEDRLVFVSSYCTKPGDFTTTGVPTKVGVTVQEKLSGWPESIPNGHIALESKEKGFVITRVAHVSTTPDITNDSIKDPKEGMLIYDIQDKCVKLFNGITWNCIRRTCNDTN